MRFPGPRTLEPASTKLAGSDAAYSPLSISSVVTYGHDLGVLGRWISPCLSFHFLVWCIQDREGMVLLSGCWKVWGRRLIAAMLPCYFPPLFHFLVRRRCVVWMS